MRHSIVTRPVGALALALILTGANCITHADAAEAKPVIQHVTVYYGDLRLDDPTGARQLVKRISSAAANACGRPPLSGPMALYVAASRSSVKCRRDAVRTAIENVNHPVVTAVYEGRAIDNRVARQ